MSVDLVLAQENIQQAIGFENYVGMLNNNINLFINLITMIATIFGIIVAIVIAFFAIRQINVDREIRKYRDEIKCQKEEAIKLVEKTKVDLSTLSKWTEEKKKEIEKALKRPASKLTQKKLENLDKKIEDLEDEIAYKRGAISATASGISGDNILSRSFSGQYRTAYSVYNFTECKNCGKTYDKNLNTINNSSYISVLSIADDKTKCPYCGNIN